MNEKKKKKKKEKSGILLTKIASEEDIYFKNWAFEFPKENIQILNECLNKFLNFSLAMFSVVTIFYDKIGFKIKPLILILLFLSTIICFIGIIPIEQNYRPNYVDEIKDSIKNITSNKVKYMNWSFILIALTMWFILLNILFNVLLTL